MTERKTEKFNYIKTMPLLNELTFLVMGIKSNKKLKEKAMEQLSSLEDIFLQVADNQGKKEKNH